MIRQQLKPWVPSILTLGLGVLTFAAGYRAFAGMFLGFFLVWTLVTYIFAVRFPGLNGYAFPRWAWTLISVGGIILLVIVLPTLATKTETLFGGLFYGAGVTMGLLAGLLGLFYATAPEHPGEESQEGDDGFHRQEGP